MKRIPTEEEQRLWKQAMRDTAPLAPSPRIAHEPPAIAVRPKPFQPPRMPIRPQAAADTPLLPGARAGIDRRTADRFRKGDYPLAATLDLHGMSRERAWQALASCLHAHYALGSRCLLVVTGKGRGGTPGVLRESLPQWLAAPELAPMVLAFEQAQPRHGGGGAYYILLRRRRG